MKTRQFRIAARQSDLARLQAYRVGDAIRAAWPDLEPNAVSYQFRASLGDLNLNEPLWKMPEKGVFTEDFIQDLREGTAEMVVHSWKDLPTEPRADTEIVATMPRADVRDLLLFRRDRLESAKSSGLVRVLTSSPRRSYNLEPFLRSHLPFAVGELRFESVRGNIPTRLKKLLSQDVEAIVVAKAALDRLLLAPETEFHEVQSIVRDVLTKTKWMILPLSANPTAAAQGALAIEISKKSFDVRSVAEKIHCQDTWESVEKERKILASYGGGCHQKIGVSVLKRPYGEITFLRGLTDQGEVLNEKSLRRSETMALRTRAQSDERIYPSLTSGDKSGSKGDEENAFFTREALPRQAWAHAENERFLWVARESAWPEGFRAIDDAVVWTAGLKTWRRLAERGVWVTGSAEGLGEDEASRMEPLLGLEKIDWLKLTHDESHHVRGPLRSCPTYHLVPVQNPPDLSKRTHFYWKSGSLFRRALELNPALRHAEHACGPGHTYRTLREVLGPEALISVYLDVDSWRLDVLGP